MIVCTTLPLLHETCDGLMAQVRDGVAATGRSHSFHFLGWLFIWLGPIPIGQNSSIESSVSSLLALIVCSLYAHFMLIVRVAGHWQQRLPTKRCRRPSLACWHGWVTRKPSWKMVGALMIGIWMSMAFVCWRLGMAGKSMEISESAMGNMGNGEKEPWLI